LSAARAAVTAAPRNHLSDLRGVGRLAIDATRGVADLVEAMHHTIGRLPAPIGKGTEGRTGGITGLVYRSVRGVTGLVGGGIDAILGRLVPMLGARDASPPREAIVAALNGVLGDYLAETGNPLAIAMSFRRGGKPLVLERAALAAAIPGATGRLLVLAHGLCMNDLQWRRHGHDHGAALGIDLGCTPVYLNYNTGLHVSANGRALAGALEKLTSRWPVPVDEITIVAHSMGGLVARSACHYGTAAAHPWLRKLRRIAFLGTPHHGAPLERGGSWIDAVLDASPYTAPFARLGKIRSAGITDLRHGNVTDEDWQGRDRFARGDRRQSVPLPKGVKCYAIGATRTPGSRIPVAQLSSDGLVPIASALGHHGDPARALHIPHSRQWIARGCGHLDLLDRPAVYRRIRRWLEAD
jgi:pimeloyl-ACP methyl ester carboxylesterase